MKQHFFPTYPTGVVEASSPDVDTNAIFPDIDFDTFPQVEDYYLTSKEIGTSDNRSWCFYFTDGKGNRRIVKLLLAGNFSTEHNYIGLTPSTLGDGWLIVGIVNGHVTWVGEDTIRFDDDLCLERDVLADQIDTAYHALHN